MVSVLALVMFATSAAEATPSDATHAERLRAVFEQVESKSMAFLDSAYGSEVVFISPLGEVHGIEELRTWYQNLFDKVETIAFEIKNTYESGDTLTVEWVMTIATDDLNRGKEVATSGASVITFDADDRVVYQRDYYDLGEFVYEHVAVLKRLVARAKKKMTP